MSIDVNALIQTHAKNKELIEVLTRRNQEISSQLTEHLKVAGKHTFESGSVTIAENNTYDTSYVESHLLPGQLKRVQVRKIDNTLVKSLYPAIHAGSKVNRGYKVTVTPK